MLLCLPTSQHVRSVIFDKGGLAETMAPGSLIIDQTSGDPEETKAIAKQLEAHDIMLADAPVSGGATCSLGRHNVDYSGCR